MTTKKKADKNEKPLNQTAHQRAMTRPEVQEALKVLQTSWSGLSPRQRCEELNVLIGLECSMRGIAKELGESESSIRRWVALANPSEEGSDCSTVMKNALTKEPQQQTTKSVGEEIRRIPSKIPAGKRAGPVIKETYPAQDHTHTSTAQQTKKITSPSSNATKEPLVASAAIRWQEIQAARETARKKTVDDLAKIWQKRQDKAQQLNSIHDQFKQRPLYDARALGRQGGESTPKTEKNLEETMERLASIPDQIKPRPI